MLAAHSVFKQSVQEVQQVVPIAAAMYDHTISEVHSKSPHIVDKSVFSSTMFVGFGIYL